MLEELSIKLPASRTTQALVLGVALGYITYRLLKKKYKLPPGPYPLPLLGNLLTFKTPDPMYKVCAQLQKKYGPVMTMYLGPIPSVFVNDADSVHEVLVQKGYDFAGRMKLHTAEVISRGYKDIALADTTPTWKIQRKVALQGLKSYLYGSKLEEKLYTATKATMDALREKTDQPINIEDYISLMIINLLQGVCFNKSSDLEDPDLRKIYHFFVETNKEFGDGLWEDIIPGLKYWPTAKYRKFISILDEFLIFVRKEVEEHTKTFSENNLRDFTDYLLHAKKEMMIENPEIENMLTDEHIDQTISDIFSAGIDTSRLTLVWAIFYLIKYPEVQTKIHQELDTVIDINQAPTLADRGNLPYTEAVLHETLRLCPIAPLIPHAAQCDSTIGEYDVPKDTMVMINVWALHYNPKVYKDPEIFRPERFLDEDGKLAPKTMSWLPFGAGRRNCLGESVARPELHLFLAILLRNFSFSCPEGKTIDLTPTGSFTCLPPPNEILATPRI